MIQIIMLQISDLAISIMIHLVDLNHSLQTPKQCRNAECTRSKEIRLIQYSIIRN